MVRERLNQVFHGTLTPVSPWDGLIQTPIEVLSTCGKKAQLALVRGEKVLLIMVSNGTRTPASQEDCCFGPEDPLQNYMSLIRIPVHYFSYDILQQRIWTAWTETLFITYCYNCCTCNTLVPRLQEKSTVCEIFVKYGIVFVFSTFALLYALMFFYTAVYRCFKESLFSTQQNVTYSRFLRRALKIHKAVRDLFM